MVQFYCLPGFKAPGDFFSFSKFKFRFPIPELSHTQAWLFQPSWHVPTIPASFFLELLAAVMISRSVEMIITIEKLCAAEQGSLVLARIAPS